MEEQKKLMLDAADEVNAFFMDEKAAWDDRCRFVHNLGEFATQHRGQVVGMDLQEGDIVIISYKGGHQQRVNVKLDSYSAIVRDVYKAMS